MLPTGQAKLPPSTNALLVFFFAPDFSTNHLLDFTLDAEPAQRLCAPALGLVSIGGGGGGGLRTVLVGAAAFDEVATPCLLDVELLASQSEATEAELLSDTSTTLPVSTTL